MDLSDEVRVQKSKTSRTQPDSIAINRNQSHSIALNRTQSDSFDPSQYREPTRR